MASDRRGATLPAFFLGNSFEVLVDLLLVGGGRFVVRPRGQTVLRFLRLKLLGQGRLGGFERLRRLPPQLVPAGEVLLERLSSGRRQRHALSFERESGAPARIRR